MCSINIFHALIYESGTCGISFLDFWFPCDNLIAVVALLVEILPSWEIASRLHHTKSIKTMVLIASLFGTDH